MNRPEKRSRREIRDLDLWDLVCWVYRSQKAHFYLRSNYDFFEMEVAAQDVRHELDVHVSVHHDAVRVHEAVRALGPVSARLIIEAAENADRPEPSTTQPRPYRVPARDELMLPSDRSGWSNTDGRRMSHIVRSEEKVRVVVLVERKTKRKGKPAPIEERATMVEVEFCPIDWHPSPAYIDMVNSIYDAWIDAMCVLLLALQDVPLKAHTVTGFAFERGPSFAPAEYGPARQERRAQLIRTDDTVGDLQMVDGVEKVVTLRRVVRVVLERPAA